MQLSIKIKDDGKWHGVTWEDVGANAEDRIAILAAKECVIHFQNGEQECFLSTGKWVEYYKSQGKASVDLQGLVLLLNLHRTIPTILNSFKGAEILTQETLSL